MDKERGFFNFNVTHDVRILDLYLRLLVDEQLAESIFSTSWTAMVQFSKCVTCPIFVHNVLFPHASNQAFKRARLDIGCIWQTFTLPLQYLVYCWFYHQPVMWAANLLLPSRSLKDHREMSPSSSVKVSRVTEARCNLAFGLIAKAKDKYPPFFWRYYCWPRLSPWGFIQEDKTCTVSLTTVVWLLTNQDGVTFHRPQTERQPHDALSRQQSEKVQSVQEEDCVRDSC